MKSIVNGKIYSNGQFVERVLIFDREIEIITGYDEYQGLCRHNSYQEMDAQGQYVVPGLIDVHIHGCQGVDVMDATPEALAVMKQEVVRNGVTSFLATTMTMAKPNIIRALDNVRTQVEREQAADYVIDGANLIGVHLEGPFINVKKKGAQPGEHVVKPDFELMTDYADLIKVCTIAPEIEGAIDMIKQFGDRVNFSIGHTDATYDQAAAGIAAGAKACTHLFNAMTGLHHRQPGVVGATFGHDIYAELIADNIHVNPQLYPVIKKVKGLDKILLITDCMRAGGLAEGVYDLGGQSVTVQDGICRLVDGTIAGSVLKLNQGLANFTTGTAETLAHTIDLATINQARYLGMEDRIGSLDIGKQADIVIMDQDFKIKQTLVQGVSCFKQS